MNRLVHELAANYDVIPLTEFVDRAKAAACPDLDTSFMEYFFELADDVNDGKFIVPHCKLIEYGVAISSQSAAMKKRLENLGLLDGKDYLLNHMSEQLPSGTKHSIVYLLTPEAFKKCLMRAKRARDQGADPVRFADYYLFLEKVVKYFSVYERARLECRNEILGKKNRILTEKNDSLLDKVNTLLVNNETLLASNETLVANNIELKSMNIDQMKNINKLLKYADDSKQQIAALHDKLDAMFDFTTEFARMTLPMWVGSSVFRTQLDQLAVGRSLPNALRRLKLMFVVGFRQGDRLLVYFSCTNFAELGKRIELLAERHSKSTMLRPSAICLISHEVNHEMARLQQMKAFPEEAKVDFDKRAKVFYVGVSPNKSEDMFHTIVTKVRQEKFQGYQLRRDSSAKDIALSPKIMDYLTATDTTFYEKTLPLCQECIDGHVKELGDGYIYARPSKKQILREDLKHHRYSDVMYALMLLNQILVSDNGSEEIDRMVRLGVITKEDARDLIRVGKSVVKVEDVKLTKEMLEQADEVERACEEI